MDFSPYPIRVDYRTRHGEHARFVALLIELLKKKTIFFVETDNKANTNLKGHDFEFWALKKSTLGLYMNRLLTI